MIRMLPLGGLLVKKKLTRKKKKTKKHIFHPGLSILEKIRYKICWTLGNKKSACWPKNKLPLYNR